MCPNDPFPESTKSHCNTCTGSRNHVVLGKDDSRWSEEVGTNPHFIEGGDDFELLKCAGCGDVHLRHRSWFSEDMTPDGDVITRTKQYPPKINRPAPRWAKETDWLLLFDSPVKDLFDEVYRALGVQATRLAAMGIRALLETAMIEKVGDAGTFASNLLALETKGFISTTQRKQLEPVIEAGHATTHRNYSPSEEDVHILLDIAENVIETLYVSPGRATSMQGRIPPRANRKNRPKS